MVRYENRLGVLESQESRKPEPNSKQTLLNTHLGNQHLSNAARYEGFLKEIPWFINFPRRFKERKRS